VSRGPLHRRSWLPPSSPGRFRKEKWDEADRPYHDFFSPVNFDIILVSEILLKIFLFIKESGGLCFFDSRWSVYRRCFL